MRMVSGITGNQPSEHKAIHPRRNAPPDRSPPLQPGDKIRRSSAAPCCRRPERRRSRSDPSHFRGQYDATHRPLARPRQNRRHPPRRRHPQRNPPDHCRDQRTNKEARTLQAGIDGTRSHAASGETQAGHSDGGRLSLLYRKDFRPEFALLRAQCFNMSIAQTFLHRVAGSVFPASRSIVLGIKRPERSEPACVLPPQREASLHDEHGRAQSACQP
jgi:hypothetical protein